MDKQRFALLFEKYLDGRLNAEEKTEFYQVIDDGSYNKELEELTRLSWDASGAISEAPTEEGLDRIRKVMDKIKPVRRMRYWPPMAAAASILVIFIISALWPAQKNQPARAALLHEIRTGPGEKRVLRLPDSSTVYLSAATTLTYSDSSARIITLSGEAFFDVASQPGNPFTVRDSEGLVTRVLGTSFNVRDYNNEKNVHISVVSGKVRVTKNDTALGTLAKDTRLVFNREQASAAVGHFAWRKDMLVFESNTLEEVVAALERTYGCTIRLEADVPKDRKLSAVFEESQGLKTILGLVGELHNLNIKTIGEDQYILYKTSRR